MTRNFWLAFGAGLGLLLLAVTMSQQATFLFRHPTNKEVRITVTRETGPIVDLAYRDPQAALAQNPHAPRVPRVELPEKDYDFGFANPLSVGRHKFVIRNRGTAELLLEVAGASCKCTVGGLAKNRLAPGEESWIELEWNTGRHLHFSHGVTLRSNDPVQREFELVVQGKVKTLLAADVGLVNAHDVAAGESKEVEFIVFSQAFRDFKVTAVENPLANFPWRAEPVSDPAVLGPLAAAAAQRIFVTIDSALLKTSQFEGAFTITAQPVGELLLELPERPREERAQVAFRGNLAARYTLFGGKIVGEAVDLGAIPSGSSRSARLVLKVRDPAPDLGELKLRCEPSFLEAQLTPRPGSTGLYDVSVRAPPTAPVCQYLGSPKLARVRIETAHPRIPTVEVPVSFAVVAP